MFAPAAAKIFRSSRERLGVGCGFGVAAGFVAVVDAVVTGGVVRLGATLPLPQPARPAASTAARIE
jgi:hypothetical protein